MWAEYVNAVEVEEGQRILSERGDNARIIAGGTDLILEIERGVRTGINTLVDITRISGLENGRAKLPAREKPGSPAKRTKQQVCSLFASSGSTGIHHT